MYIFYCFSLVGMQKFGTGGIRSRIQTTLIKCIFLTIFLVLATPTLFSKIHVHQFLDIHKSIPLIYFTTCFSLIRMEIFGTGGAHLRIQTTLNKWIHLAIFLILATPNPLIKKPRLSASRYLQADSIHIFF